MFKIKDNLDGTVTIALGDNATTMHTAQLDDFILELARTRAEMLPEPDFDPNLDNPITTAYSPRFWIGNQPEIAGVQLMLRHFGYNWLSFMFRLDEAKELARMMTENVEILEHSI